jgi:hypothetical protein
MTAQTVPLQELTVSTIKLLCREIGVVNTARFLNLCAFALCVLRAVTASAHSVQRAVPARGNCLPP